MKRAPVPDDVHRRVDILASRNDLDLKEAYPLLLGTLVDENGELRDGAVDALRETLPAEDETAF